MHPAVSPVFDIPLTLGVLYHRCSRMFLFFSLFLIFQLPFTTDRLSNIPVHNTYTTTSVSHMIEGICSTLIPHGANASGGELSHVTTSCRQYYVYVDMPVACKRQPRCAMDISFRVSQALVPAGQLYMRLPEG